MSDEVRVITNNIPRDVIEAWQLSAEQRKEFDYIDWDKVERGEESGSFVRYKGDLLDLGDCEHWGMPWGGPHPEWAKGWHFYKSDSFFSGLLFRWPPNDTNGEPDYERVVVGRYVA